MTRFRFSLQRILDLRASAEKLQAAIMQRAAVAEGQRREDSAASAADLDRIQVQTSEIAAAPAGMWHAFELSTAAARAQHEDATDALREAEAQRLEEQGRFTDARMARRSLERLREKQAADWTVQADRTEQALSDEISQQRTPRGEDG